MGMKVSELIEELSNIADPSLEVRMVLEYATGRSVPILEVEWALEEEDADPVVFILPDFDERGSA